jgi:hypothetical protein
MGGGPFGGRLQPLKTRRGTYGYDVPYALLAGAARGTGPARSEAGAA